MHNASGRQSTNKAARISSRQHADSERSKLGVELTQAGQQYLYFANQAIESLQRGQASLDQLKQQTIFTLHTLPSVASLWLMPKVLHIMEQHPDLEIRVEASRYIGRLQLEPL